jgi:uncharacterized protein YggE
MLFVWKPWRVTTGSKDRTVQVSGQSTVKATPDEFVFSPTYDFTNTDKQAALSDLTAKSNEVVAKLKSLGVADNKIKTNADSWSYPVYGNGTAQAPTYTLRLTVTAGTKELAQKVQDYLVTTTPSGVISPQATFSEAKRKTLESQARDAATKDARSKADQSAKNLGFKISGVKTVEDGTGFGGGIYPMSAQGTSADAKALVAPSLTVQPGENDLSYTVTVVYFIK